MLLRLISFFQSEEEIFSSDEKTFCPHRLYTSKRKADKRPATVGLNNSFLPSWLGVNAEGKRT